LKPTVVITVLLIQALFILSSSGPLMAQGSFDGIPIGEITTQSNIGFGPKEVTRLTGLKAGDPYSPRVIRRTIDLLYQTGLFTDIQVEAEIREGGVRVTYIFVEKNILSGLKIRGNWRVLDRTIKEVLDVHLGEEFTENGWKKAVSKLLSYYQNYGYFRARVDSDIDYEEGSNNVHVTVHVHEGERALISDIEFTGNTVFPLRAWMYRSYLFFKFSSAPGEKYSSEEVGKDLQTILSHYHSEGYLQAVVGPPETVYKSSTNEVSLKIPVEAGSRLDLTFEGNRFYKDSRLSDQLLFRDEKSYQEYVFEASAERIRQFYRSNGFPDVKVSWTRQASVEEDAVSAEFKIEEGPRLCIRSVNFEGNREFTSRALKKQMLSRPPLFPFSCQPVDSKLLEGDMDALREVFQEKGYLAVKITQSVSLPENAESLRRAKASIAVNIEEGPQTRIGAIMFTGRRAFPDSQLLSRSGLRTGIPYNRKSAGQGLEELIRFHQKKGYLYAKIELREHLSEDHSEVRLEYAVDSDEIVRVGRIFLDGNTMTRNYVITRELKIHTGEIYDEEKIQLSRHQLLQLGFLRDIRFHPVIPVSESRKEYTKDMLLSVRERPPKALEFGFGYADVERFRGFAQISHRNISGTGRLLTLRGEASSIERKSTLSYLEPWFLSLPVNARLTGSYELQVRRAYDLTALNMSFGIEKDLSKRVKTSLIYQVAFENFSDINPGVLEDQDKDRANVASINPTVTYDTRDNPFDPRSGTLSGVAFRYAKKALGSKRQFRKVTIHSSWYFPLTRWMVLALSARAGAEIEFGKDKRGIPPNDLYFAGGRSTVRGYREDDLGIVGETIDASTGGPTGGQAVLIGNVELRFSLPWKLGLVLFNDRGQVWYPNGTNFSPSGIDLSQLKSTVGAGLRYNTPVGPLRLDVGYKLDRERNLCPDCDKDHPVRESPYEIHFTLGHPF
jgi:outer membrane protein insertion porin family